MVNTYVAVDIGASSGRLMLSQPENGRFTLKEVHRFKNGFSEYEGADRWNTGFLLENMLIGLEKVKRAGINECFLGIDTWGVDYCLLDKDQQAVNPPISYRDCRTEKAIEEFEKHFSLAELYRKTGIQLQSFNTIFQLFKEDSLDVADKLLLMPDYLGYLLTGKMALEKTNASTMQLLNLATRKLDEDLLTVLDIQKELFPKLTEPGTILGALKKADFPAYDLPDVTVITIASHDTASAVAATPGQGENWAYISSGTWSLMGVELEEGISTPEAFDANFTNEWGVQGTIRFLKNIMGMWLIQEVARMQDYRFTYPEMAELASQEPAFQSLIDVNDPRFLNPKNMIEAVQEFCRETEQPIPETAGELARCIYDSLALCYAIELQKLKKITGKDIRVLHIVGGGSNNTFLNQLTANTCGIEVLAGPDEATAIGNLLVQMVATQGFGTLAEGRESIKQSFELKQYMPHFSEEIPAALLKYQTLTNKLVKQ